jgi:hypothetical protein
MKFLSLFLIGVLLSGCAGMNAGPKASYDKFTGVGINQTTGNTLPNHFPENFSVILDMRQEVSPSATNYFMLVGSASLNGGVLVPAFGQSLFVLADSNRIAFSTTLNHTQNSLSSFYFYPATEQEIRAIASAQSVEVRILTISGGKFERTLAKKNIENFRDFTSRFLPVP